MTSKLPWATAAAIIVVAAIGVWAIWGQVPVTPPTPPPPGEGEWTLISGGTLSQALAMPAGSKSGIVKFYIMKHGQYNKEENLEDNSSGAAGENCMGSATASGFNFNILYDVPFDIVVEVIGHDDNMGHVNENYLRVDLTGHSQLEGWSISPENSTNEMEYPFGSPPEGYIYRNVVWDNDGHGYILKADDNLVNIQVKFYLRG